MASWTAMIGAVLVGSCFVLAPVMVLGFFGWKWRRELAESARLRQPRSTQVR